MNHIPLILVRVFLYLKRYTAQTCVLVNYSIQTQMNMNTMLDHTMLFLKKTRTIYTGMYTTLSSEIKYHTTLCSMQKYLGLVYKENGTMIEKRLMLGFLHQKMTMNDICHTKTLKLCVKS